jgi:hypothetical protein
MASGLFIFPNLAKLNFFNATNILGANLANFKLLLLTNVFAPNDATNEVLADLTDEIANGNGYSTGGIALTGVALTQAGGTVKFTSNPAVWTAAGGSIPAWRYGYLYYNGTLNSKVSPLVGHFLGDNTPADIPATTNGNTLTVTMNAAGIMAAT